MSIWDDIFYIAGEVLESALTPSNEQLTKQSHKNWLKEEEAAEEEALRRTIRRRKRLEAIAAEEEAKYSKPKRRSKVQQETETKIIFEKLKNDEHFAVKGKIVELIVTIECYLKNMGATGKTVNELLLNVKDKLPLPIFNTIKQCNHLRNNMVHKNYVPSHTELEQFKFNLVQIRYYFDPQHQLKETEVISDILKG